jgi:hypothetical protein
MVTRPVINEQRENDENDENQNIEQNRNGMGVQEYIQRNNDMLGIFHRVHRNIQNIPIINIDNEIDIEEYMDVDSESDSDSDSESDSDSDSESDSDDDEYDPNDPNEDNNNDIVNEEYDMNIIDEARFVVGNNLFNKNIHNILSELEDARWNLLERLRFVEAYSRYRENDIENQENYYEERVEDIEFDELDIIINDYQRQIDGQYRENE